MCVCLYNVIRKFSLEILMNLRVLGISQSENAFLKLCVCVNTIIKKHIELEGQNLIYSPYSIIVYLNHHLQRIRQPGVYVDSITQNHNDRQTTFRTSQNT